MDLCGLSGGVGYDGLCTDIVRELPWIHYSMDLGRTANGECGDVHLELTIVTCTYTLYIIISHTIIPDSLFMTTCL